MLYVDSRGFTVLLLHVFSIHTEPVQANCSRWKAAYIARAGIMTSAIATLDTFAGGSSESELTETAETDWVAVVDTSSTVQTWLVMWTVVEIYNDRIRCRIAAKFICVASNEIIPAWLASGSHRSPNEPLVLVFNPASTTGA